MGAVILAEALVSMYSMFAIGPSGVVRGVLKTKNRRITR